MNLATQAELLNRLVTAEAREQNQKIDQEALGAQEVRKLNSVEILNLARGAILRVQSSSQGADEKCPADNGTSGFPEGLYNLVV